MKKILICMALLALSICLLASCADNSTTEEDVILLEEYDTSLDNKKETAAEHFFALLTEKGYKDYILAFPPEYIEGFQKELGYNDEEFSEALDNATFAFHSNRDITYEGGEYHIEWEYVGEEDVDYSTAQEIIHDLRNYCYMPSSPIEKVVDVTYSVRTYGYDLNTNEIYMDETTNQVVKMLYITHEGWYVSPTELQLP